MAFTLSTAHQLTVFTLQSQGCSTHYRTWLFRINHGANMGDDTLYSGTVAAATEGYLLGVPSIAFFSLENQVNILQTAARVAVDLVEHIKATPFTHPVLLNVNVPDVAFSDLQGTEITRLGRRHHAEPVIKATQSRGETVYWVGAVGHEQDAGEGTDFYALRQKRSRLHLYKLI